MSIAVALVARHLAAGWKSDWDDLHRTLSPAAKLRISHGDWTHAELGIGNFYRHISQAWDFAPGDVKLSDSGDGIVQAKLRLTNGGDWVKEVEGEYRVSGDRIDSIHLIDNQPFKSADAPA